MSPSSLKELGITAEQIAKADKITDCIQDEGFWKALQGIAELWEPVAEAIYMLEGNHSTLGDAYWAIHAIQECMDRLDEIDYILFSGAVEELQDAWWEAKEYLWTPVLTLGALLDP